MSDALDRARKTCPQCGSENRIAAKICTNCGYAFAAASLAAPTQMPGMPLKRCPECGKENRLSAKVCSQCGHQFQGVQQGVGVAQPQSSLPPVSAEGRKWCPRCGTVCRLEAKVCPQCGHHFRTDFGSDARTDVHSDVKDATPTAPVLTEAPIAQMPPDALTLPTQYDAPMRLPSLPDPPVMAPPAPTFPYVPDAPAVPVAATPSSDMTSGEPAPDLSDLDLDSLRRGSPDHVDAAGRVIISLFKKDR